MPIGDATALPVSTGFLLTPPTDLHLVCPHQKIILSLRDW